MPNFRYTMVAVELNGMLDRATLAKTSIYDAMLHAQAGHEAMCQLKLADFQAAIKEIQKQLALLDSKIEYIRSSK